MYDEPYELTVSDIISGEYSITAMATDNEGNTTLSNNVIVNVEEDNHNGNGISCSDYNTWNSRVTYYPGDMFEYKNEVYEVLNTARNIKPKRGLAHGYYTVLGQCS